MSDSIRLRNRSRLYDFGHRLLVAILRARAVGLHVGTFLPYSGAKTLKSVAVDEVAFPGFGNKLVRGVKHQMDGSRVTFWYTAMHKPTQKQIDKARYAIKVLRIPRKRYTGTLIDVFRHRESLYILLGGVLERDREDPVNFRMFNLDDGDLFRAYVETVKQKRIPLKKQARRYRKARLAQRKLRKKPRVKKFATKRKKK